MKNVLNNNDQSNYNTANIIFIIKQLENLETILNNYMADCVTTLFKLRQPVKQHLTPLYSKNKLEQQVLTSIPANRRIILNATRFAFSLRI